MAGLADLPALAARLSAALASARIQHAISGAAAMAAHGYVRATRDVDVLVQCPQLRLPEVFEIVRAQGFLGSDVDLLRALRERYMAELRAGPVSVEVLIPVLPYHRTLIDRAVRRRVGSTDVPFVALEDLIVLKLLWHRAKDVPDVQALLTLAGPALDPAYLRTTLASILPAADPRHAELVELIRRFASGG